MVPHILALGSGGVPPVPPTILMSAYMAGVSKTYDADMRIVRGTPPEPRARI